MILPRFFYFAPAISFMIALSLGTVALSPVDAKPKPANPKQTEMKLGLSFKDMTGWKIQINPKTNTVYFKCEEVACVKGSIVSMHFHLQCIAASEKDLRKDWVSSQQSIADVIKQQIRFGDYKIANKDPLRIAMGDHYYLNQDGSKATEPMSFIASGFVSASDMSMTIASQATNTETAIKNFSQLSSLPMKLLTELTGNNSTKNDPDCIFGNFPAWSKQVLGNNLDIVNMVCEQETCGNSSQVSYHLMAFPPSLSEKILSAIALDQYMQLGAAANSQPVELTKPQSKTRNQGKVTITSQSLQVKKSFLSKPGHKFYTDEPFINFGYARAGNFAFIISSRASTDAQAQGNFNTVASQLADTLNSVADF